LTELLAGMQAADAGILLLEILDTPNARSSAGRLEDLLAGEAYGAVKLILPDPALRLSFLATVGGSRFLTSVVSRNPSMAETLFLRRGYLVTKTREDKEEELRALALDLVLPSDFDRALRLYKEADYLRIGCRDLTEVADVREVMAELSDLAGACIQAAVDFHLRRLFVRYGAPPDTGDQGGFVVIGMGKLSGRELNFSSDVDLIFLRGPEEGRTTGPESVSIARFYEVLATSVTKSLSDLTEDGFVFRVDLRLRPEGERGELVPSLNNAVEYYLGWGRTWERAALMKAVPLAGDRLLGESFVEELEPFIYRKHLDYSTLEEMRVMKQGIEKQLKRKPGVNIKLGQGGIREIEFFVQALQLINAGKIRRVRTPSTLQALTLLNDTGLLDAETGRSLEEAYRFFRKTEHRIQINHQLQTHELPRTAEDQEELARRMGYREDSLKLFLADLDRRRRTVEELFAGLFYHSGDDNHQKISPEAKKIVESVHDEKRTLSLLAEHGFEDPAASYHVLKSLVTPADKGPVADKSRQLLERLAPLFVEELLKVPEPGNALISLAGFVESLQPGQAYFSTFLENPATIGFLIKILGESRFFTDLLTRHPQSIDSLIARSSVSAPKEREALQAELEERSANCESFEDELDVLRRFKNEEILEIGVHHLMGDIESTAARWLVTELAETCLNRAVVMACREMNRKFGGWSTPEELPFVILALGKLGGMEMTYLSDLDIIFIYDHSAETMGRFSTHEWFTRLASRIISILTVPTSEGAVFAIDTRLRPSGNKGPLVSSLSSFRDYHRTTSKLWEKQALTRARPVTGPANLREGVTAIVRECITGTDLTPDDLAEMARLRGRMQNELALEDDLHVDLKTGHGGLVDVEFFVQGNILKHSKDHPEILCTNTLEAIAALYRTGLLDAESFRTLDSGYRFLSNLEDRLRIMEHRSVNRMPLQGEKLRGLARRLGYGNDGGKGLLEDYFRTTTAVRAMYNSFFLPHGREIVHE
jgi:[glutamine synthetase] adenylyltransferase / [glutamine synthetase]-adenylyl-L-tyrosine phosphorylase